MGTSFPSFWNPSTISGDASLALRHTWDTTPEGATSPASNDAGVRTYSITFSQPIKEFRLHIDWVVLVVVQVIFPIHPNGL